MKHIIHEIRRQPDHIRELATMLCTIAVVAVIGLVWFRSFQHNIYAMLNPETETEAQDQYFASESKSLFGSMIKAFSDSKAQISGFFSGDSNSPVINNQPHNDTSGATYPLPVSGNR